jgi:hypothetical protein
VPRWLLVLGLGAYGLLLVTEESSMLLLVTANFGVDFRDYWSGATSLAMGRDLYWWIAAGLPLEYVYPPPLALLLLPLVWALDYGAARWLWLVFSVLCLAVGVALVWRVSGVRSERRWLPVVACLPLLPAITWALGIGQLSPQLLLLVAGAYAALSARRPALAGALLGVAASVKVFPALLGGYLLLRREWRALGAAIAVGLACLGLAALVVGWEPYWTYVSGVVPAQRRLFAAPFNVSVPGLFARLLVANTFTTPLLAADALGQALSALASAALLAATGYAIWRAPAERASLTTAFALAVAATLLVGPINGRYNLVIALLPLVVAAAQVQARWPRHLGWLVAAALLLGLPIEPYDLWPVRLWYVTQGIDLPVTEWPWRLGWGNLLTAGPIFGLLALWGLLLRLCLEPQTTAPAHAQASRESVHDRA